MTDSAQGYDVSSFQGPYDWAATSGLSFGICRATEALGGSGWNSPDPELAWNWTRIKAKGLARGAYHLFHPELDAAQQAEYFVSTLRSHTLDTTDTLWVDNEVLGNPKGLPAPQVAAAAQVFMSRLDQLCPHNPRGVYANLSYVQEGYCDGLGEYPLWVADWGVPDAPPPPAPFKRWTIWQWASGENVEGSPYPTPDKNAYNGTEAELKAWISSYQPKPPTVEVEVQSGQLNNGSNALTIISVPWGTAKNIAFGCDNGVQGLPPAVLRVAVFDTTWHVTNNVTVDSTKGQTIIAFPDASKTGVISVIREDSGEVVVGYEVS
jgi:lysozyme